MTPELRAALANEVAAWTCEPWVAVAAIAPIIDAAMVADAHNEGYDSNTRLVGSYERQIASDALLAAADDLDALRENGETWAGNHASRQSYNAGVLAAQEMLRARANEGNPQ